MNLLPFMTHILGLHDPHAVEHSRNVNGLASGLARKLGLPSRLVEQIEFSAAVHDIGKMAINDFIVNKPGQFTEAEYLMVQQHSQLGANMIEKLDLDPIIAAIVLQHHENFDGTGYPQRLSSDQISVGARIIRITDTYDALMTHRGYRPARSHKQAISTMEAEAQHFDPEILDVFLRMRPNRDH